MKPHLVILCGILYPNPSATGLCAFRYGSLLAGIYDIEYVALSDNGSSEKAMYEGYVVHTLSSKRLALEHQTKGMASKAIHLFGSAQLKLFLQGNLRWYRKAAYRKLEEIHADRKIDAILTVCSPFPAHQAGVDFKQAHPDVRFCAYTVDPFAASDRIIPFFRKFDDLVKQEREVSSKADCLLLSEEALNTRNDIYGAIETKVALPYLLPQSVTAEGGLFDKEHIHCVYAGSFYKDIRNPEYMLKVFSALTDKKIVLHLYSAGCAEIVNSYGMCKNILSNGYVSQEELKRVYASCDILIGVGNKLNDFLPSKTYEYLSWRKPIVSFNPKGYPNSVLAMYPYALQITDDIPVAEAAEQLDAFVKAQRGKTICEEELKSIYRTNTAENIRDILLKALKSS